LSRVLNGATPTGPTLPLQYFAFFVEEERPALTSPRGKVAPLSTGEGKPEFDIRQLHSYSLLNPSVKLDVGPEQQDSMKQNLIYQFQKDDLLYEVYELLNPAQLFFRIKVYELSTFRMLTSTEIGEAELKVELQKDKKSNLAGPQSREDLAKYIINNAYFDEVSSSLQFLVSNLVEEL
jgi:hypothetical protein